ncbi:DUF1177 family protein [Paraburkholderia bannensis]|uniref:DUF1177 family protein n=1 Tax=Paraburkholderia bannensis TaxID=765414 RepID=UPI002ABD601B|nr:DUF1177 family protein [Paraburkholderia bannensis]
MALSQVIAAHDFLDSAIVTGDDVVTLFAPYSTVGVFVESNPVNDTEVGTQPDWITWFVKITIPGTSGKNSGATDPYPTLGINGRCGGTGARPQEIGMVSDGDGPVCALAAALKLADMKTKSDALLGDVIVTFHISPQGYIDTSKTPPMMGLPVTNAVMNSYEVDAAMDAILSVDASKANYITKQRGFAISPTAMQGYVLKVSSDLVNIMESTTGQHAFTFPLAIQDITPYDNGISHFNSIMQPSVATSAPVVGVAITAESAVSGSAVNANHEIDLAEAVQFCLATAKAYTARACDFYDATEFNTLVQKYGTLTVFQTEGN